jgi:sialic acid synthase SpsE/spore coat polysaccharide biosynthesis protein SpsF (cytidylyltransferase family)
MKIAVILLCRTSSVRLPNKIFSEFCGATVLTHILLRLTQVLPISEIIVATSDHISDNEIETYCNRASVKCFRGSLENVIDRFYQCAAYYKLDYAVRINGDNVFVDGATLLQMLSIARTDRYDLVSNVPGRTFPYGMSIEIIKTSTLADLCRNLRNSIHAEHVTSYIYENIQDFNVYTYENTDYSNLEGLNLALDTYSDLENITKISSAINSHDLFTARRISRLVENIDVHIPWLHFSPYLIAEVGGNHEGNFDYARKLVEEACQSGAHCVKVQIYTGDNLVSFVEDPDRNIHFKKFELSIQEHRHLADICRAYSVDYNASIWDIPSLEIFDEYLNFYKVGSGDLTAFPILRWMATKGKPILLSTGLSNLDDVSHSINYIRSINPLYNHPSMICILQCTSMYPIPLSEANLSVMHTYRDLFSCESGYSDHTEGDFAIKQAISMDARVIEFHYTDSRDGKKFRDHKVSLLNSEIKALTEYISQYKIAAGISYKVPQQSEIDSGHTSSFRRAVYLNKPVKVGQIISESDLITLRPCHGVDARDYSKLIGSVALRDIAPFTAINMNRDISQKDIHV